MGYSPWGHKESAWLSDTTQWQQKDRYLPRLWHVSILKTGCNEDTEGQPPGALSGAWGAGLSVGVARGC